MIAKWFGVFPECKVLRHPCITTGDVGLAAVLVNSRPVSTDKEDEAESVNVCYFRKVNEIGLRRVRCHCSLKMKKEQSCHTFGCLVYKVRLHKT